MDVRINSEVILIDRKNKKVRVKTNGTEYEESYDKLVLSPGAEPIKPDIKGIDNPKIFTLRTIPDTYKITDFVESKNPKSAAIAKVVQNQQVVAGLRKRNAGVRADIPGAAGDQDHGASFRS